MKAFKLQSIIISTFAGGWNNQGGWTGEEGWNNGGYWGGEGNGFGGWNNAASEGQWAEGGGRWTNNRKRKGEGQGPAWNGAGQ